MTLQEMQIGDDDVLPGSGSAQERHFGTSIEGRAAQHEAQQEATLPRQGRSRRQTTHHAGRTIRSASRPMRDNALPSVICTREF